MLVDHMTARPMTEGEREEALRIANNIVGSGTVQHYSPSAAEYKLADALLSTSAAERGMREALQLFRDHYPRGINPWLDEAHSKARAALSEDLKCDHDWAAEDDKGHRCKRCGAVT